jgi:UDP-N-acetylglucosamine 2-epimerase (non-hydrolysing)
MGAKKYRVLLVAGARPNFMKIAPLARELARHPDAFESILIHTGQHYDGAMSRVFFEQLALPRPAVDLGVGSGSHAQQTATIMMRFEPVILEWHPDLVLVVGDVNSTLACALVAAKLGVRVAHVEAGLRSFDRSMPEEMNRLLTDQLSDLLFVSEQSGIENLRREGIEKNKVFMVGNVMIDTLLAHREPALALNTPARLGFDAATFGVITLHRPSNVDDPVALEELLGAVAEICEDVPLVFPVHPRTRHGLSRSHTAGKLCEKGRLHLCNPMSYLEFLGLMARSVVVLTDSGGVQEETTVLGIPCLTLRTSTERPVTITHGTNHLAGTRRDRIVEAWRNMKMNPRTSSMPPLWDGRSAERIVAILRSDALQPDRVPVHQALRVNAIP